MPGLVLMISEMPLVRHCQLSEVIIGTSPQVKPFILRRTKDSVLKDLPPKILQDVFCNLSPLQASLYDHMTASTSGDLSGIADGRGVQDPAQTAPHVFQVISSCQGR